MSTNSIKRTNSITAYKGFSKDMTCRGFKYEEGKTYECDTALLCKSGFHACLNPLDVLKYYNPSNSVYHRVILEDVCEERNSDSKVCAKKITIKERLSEVEMVQHAYNYLKEHSEEVNDSVALSEHKAVISEIFKGFAISGHEGISSTGFEGISIAGMEGVAISNYGIAISDSYGASSASNQSVAVTGIGGIALSKDSSISAANEKGLAVSEDNSVSAALCYGTAKSGLWGVSASGYFGTSISKDNSVSVSSSHGIAKTGMCGIAAAGFEGLAVAEDYGIAVVGEQGSAQSKNFGISISKGKSQTGADGVSVARGQNVRVKGDLNSLLVIVEEGFYGNILHFATAIVGQDGIEPNTWYKVDENNKLVKCE